MKINTAGLQRHLDEITKLQDRAGREFNACVQAVADTYRVHIATGHMSDTFSVARDDGDWHREESREFPQVFAELKRLEKMAEPFGIGQTNLQMWNPIKK